MWRTVSGIGIGRKRGRILKTPTIVAAGALAGGTAAATYDLTANGITGYADNDVILFLIETAAETPPSTPTDYNYLTAYSVGVAAAADAVALHSAWYRVSGTPANPSFGDPGDHILMRALLIRGCRTNAAPIVNISGVADSQSEPITWAAGATTSDNNLLLFAAAHGQDLGAAWITSITDGKMTNGSQAFTANGSTLGNGGGLACYTATKRRRGAITSPSIDAQNITQPQNFVRAIYACLPQGV